jgi:RNase P subunit RPR2
MSKRRSGNRDVVKYMDAIGKNEKATQHRKLKARAICTHTKAPFDPALQFRKDDRDPNKVTWVCRICGEPVDLRRLEDAELDKAIETVAQACNLVKLFASDSESDQKLVSEYISDIQFKTRAVLKQAYKTALNSSGRQQNRNQNRRRSEVSWGE